MPFDVVVIHVYTNATVVAVANVLPIGAAIRAAANPYRTYINIITIGRAHAQNPAPGAVGAHHIGYAQGVRIAIGVGEQLVAGAYFGEIGATIG